MTAAPPDTFRPVGDLAAVQVASAAAGTGDLARDLLAMLREAGGVRTLGEISADVCAPVPDIGATLAALEATGLVHRRDLEMDGGNEPCWWAPRVPFAMPWNKEGRR